MQLCLQPELLTTVCLVGTTVDPVDLTLRLNFTPVFDEFVSTENPRIEVNPLMGTKRKLLGLATGAGELKRVFWFAALEGEITKPLRWWFPDPNIKGELRIYRNLLAQVLA